MLTCPEILSFTLKKSPPSTRVYPGTITVLSKAAKNLALWITPAPIEKTPARAFNKSEKSYLFQKEKVFFGTKGTSLPTP